MFSAVMICFIRRIWSSVSRMVKSDFSPASSAWRRRIFAPIEWNVPSHCMPSTTPPISSPTRFFISRAALLVKVTQRICQGLARPGGEQVRHPRGQHARLARARAGEHQHRPLGRLHRLALLRVQPVEIARPAHPHGAGRDRQAGGRGGIGARGNAGRFVRGQIVVALCGVRHLTGRYTA